MKGGTIVVNINHEVRGTFVVKEFIVDKKMIQKENKQTKKTAEEEQAPPADLREFNSTKRNI